VTFVRSSPGLITLPFSLIYSPKVTFYGFPGIRPGFWRVNPWFWSESDQSHALERSYSQYAHLLAFQGQLLPAG
jgi:hypothetical protein